MKMTSYRELYASPKLKKLLDSQDSAINLWVIYCDWKKTAHEESRINRNINADTVIKDLNIFIKRYKKAIKETSDMVEMSGLMIQLAEIERELVKKRNKRAGGFKADKAKKEPMTKEKTTDWYTLHCSPFSVNFMYEFRYGKKVRSQSYEKWRNNIDWYDVDSMIEIWNKYSIDVREKVALDIEFITVSGMDTDNIVKSFQDSLFQDFFRLPEDNNVVELNVKRIGTCETYDQGIIRFRIREVR